MQDIEDIMDNMARDFTRRQKKYVITVSEVFNMKNAKGQIFPYHPQPYQIDFHADCMLATDDYTNRITSKSRGIGATAMCMIDATMVAHTYDNIKLPVGSITGQQADGPVEWANWLVDNTQIEGFFDRNTEINSRCVLGNKSTIFAVPGHNPDALRNYRTVFNVYDEFAFHQYPKRMKAAGDACLTEGGQINILSTLNGTENEHYRIIKNAEEFGYKVYFVPMFDSEVFDVERSIFDQVTEGLITPISPWANLRKLEDARKSDPIAFMQEYMCSPEDAKISFMPEKLIAEIVRPAYYMEQTHRVGNNPYYCGIDFASENDISAFVIFEYTDYGWIQRARVPVKKKDTVQQNRLLRELNDAFQFDLIAIDMTGPGTGFYHYAREDFGSRAIGISFASRHLIDEEDEHLYSQRDKKYNKKSRKISIPIKRAMASYMKREAEKGRALFIDHPVVRSHLHKVSYDDLDAARDKDGHADEFWGAALAMWGRQHALSQILSKPITSTY